MKVELFWSFRSPYSYLATRRYVELQGELDFPIRIRPVYPIAVRDPAFFERVDPMWVAYLMNDTKRVAEYLDIPFRWPVPDPIVMEMETRTISPDQPYIHRITRLGVAAARRGRGLAFIDEVSRTIWAGDVDNWHEGTHLAEAAGRAGLDLAELDQEITDDQTGIDAEIDANHQALEQSGHWGVPTLAVEGEAFFGQDRVDIARWRILRGTGDTQTA